MWCADVAEDEEDCPWVSLAEERGVPAGVSAVTVMAAAPVIETTKSEMSSVVNEQAIQNLPRNTRGVAGQLSGMASDRSTAL
jgi:hypothetical protein